MMTTLEIAQHREQYQQVFSAHGVTLAYLFGSQAEEDEEPGD